MPNATSGLLAELQLALGEAYAVHGEIAEGRTAHLFVATELALGRPVALKVLRPELRRAVDAERFRREIRLAAGVSHPNIVPILTAGAAGRFLYYTMPFLEGHSLRVLLERHGAFAVGDVVSILEDLAKALASAHSRGIVHRDVKPENVLIEHGTALLTDFGIATALHAATIGGNGRRSPGMALGTPMYVSPEQSTGDPRLDHRSDLYSLGVVAYEMLAGQPPFTYQTQDAMLAAHRSEVPVPIESRRTDVPAWLARLVMQLLRKRPDDRPQSADEVLRLLDSSVTISAGAAAVSLPSRVARKGARRVRRRRLIVALLAMVCLGALGDYVRRPTQATSAPAEAIAVLPFATVGHDSLEQAFADGLTDELAASLAAFGGLRVVSRTAVAVLQDEHVGALRIADSLHAVRVLEGAVVRSGDRFRVSTQLTSAGDGAALWSATYERSAHDPYVAQDEIAGDIVRAVGDVGRSRPATNR